MKTLLNKKLVIAFTAVVVCIVISTANAQNTFPSTGAAGIGTTTPNASSLLEIKSTTKGMLIPRMTLAQRNAIATPATGLLIYQTNSTPGFYYYSGTAWTAVTPKSWSLTGNAGTDSSKNFMGTTDAHPLELRVNNNKSGWIDYDIAKANTGFGYQSLFANTSGLGNSAFGWGSLRYNTTGNSNTAVGDYSLYLNSFGAGNTAVGVATLYHNGGADNTAVGRGALFANSSGSYNTAEGAQSLASNTIGSNNTANGDSSLGSNTVGNNNSAFGKNALLSNDNGNNNTAVGWGSLYGNLSGTNNTATGSYSLVSNVTGSNNTADGYQALILNNGGSNNTGVGNNTLYLNQFGNNNTATGSSALYNNTANNNTADGAYALYYNTTGIQNVGIGDSALYSNSTGGANTALGFNALHGQRRLGNNSEMYDNTAIGSYAMYKAYANTDAGIAQDNTALGSRALLNETYGFYNTAIGADALSTNVTANDNTALGYHADVSVDGITNATVIGAEAVVNASNKMQLGSSTTILATSNGYTIVSDGRFKEQIKNNDVPGLAFINKLRPVTYNFNYKKFDDFLRKDAKKNDSPINNQDYQNHLLEKARKRELGFIAQDVDKVIRDNNYTFTGVYTPQNENDNYALDYSRFVVPLVKAMQELSAKNDSLQNQINELRTMIVSNQSTGGSQQSVNISLASLEQNIPNPFNHATSISYTLPQKFASAQIVITDKNGSAIKSVSISGSGKGSLTVDASTLSSGAYQYALIVDGKLIAAKQMEHIK